MMDGEGNGDMMPQDMDPAYNVQFNVEELCDKPAHLQDAHCSFMVAQCANRCWTKTRILMEEKMKRRFVRVPHGKKCNRRIKMMTEAFLPGLAGEIRENERSMAYVSRISGEWKSMVFRDGLSSLTAAMVCLTGFFIHIRQSFFTPASHTDVFTSTVYGLMSKLLCGMQLVLFLLLIMICRLLYGISFEGKF